MELLNITTVIKVETGNIVHLTENLILIISHVEINGTMSTLPINQAYNVLREIKLRYVTTCLDVHALNQLEINSTNNSSLHSKLKQTTHR